MHMCFRTIPGKAPERLAVFFGRGLATAPYAGVVQSQIL